MEETIHGRILYFDADGTLRWTYFNRADNGKTFYVGWSRIMYDEQDIQNVNKFLQSKGKCNN